MKLTKWSKEQIIKAILKKKLEERDESITKIKNDYVEKCSKGLYSAETQAKALELGSDWYCYISSVSVGVKTLATSNSSSNHVSGKLKETIIVPRGHGGNVYVIDGTAAGTYHNEIRLKIDTIEREYAALASAVRDRVMYKTTDKALKDSWPEIAVFVDEIVSPELYKLSLPALANDDVNRRLGLL